jgi:hypothetical protein
MHARVRSQGVAGITVVVRNSAGLSGVGFVGRLHCCGKGAGTVRNGAGLSGDLGVGGKIAPACCMEARIAKAVR